MYLGVKVSCLLLSAILLIDFEIIPTIFGCFFLKLLS